MLKLLASIDAKWKEIAECLKVPDGKIEGLEQSNKRDITRLSDALQKWMDTKTSDVTWEKIIDVVDNPPVSKPDEAQEMREFLQIPKNYERYMNQEEK